MKIVQDSVEKSYTIDSKYTSAVANLVTGKVNLAVCNFVNQFLSNDVTKTFLFEEVGKTLVEEAKALCSTKFPSILRNSTKESLEELPLEKIATELEVH